MRRALPWLGLATAIAGTSAALWRLAQVPIEDYMPHGLCYLQEPALRRLHVWSDLAIWLAYDGISVALAWVLWRRRGDLPVFLLWVGAGFVVFVLSCGQTHLMDVLTVWRPEYWIQGGVKAITAVVSVATLAALAWLAPAILRIPSPRLLEQRTAEAEANRREADVQRADAVKRALDLEEERRRTDAALAEAEERQRVIERQMDTILDMETPIIRADDRVVLLPLIGIVTTERTARVMEVLLHRVVAERAKHVVIDVSGVTELDTSVADHLLTLVRAIRLLGASTIITGIRPAIAQTMAMIGVGLEGVRAHGTVEEALEECRRGFAPARRTRC